MQPTNFRAHWSEQAEKWFSASVMCVVEIKRRTFGSISYFLKPTEESGTEDRTETILPPSTLVTLRPFSLSLSFSLSLYHPLSPQPEQFRTHHKSRDVIYSTAEKYVTEGGGGKSFTMAATSFHPEFVESSYTSSAMQECWWTYLEKGRRGMRRKEGGWGWGCRRRLVGGLQMAWKRMCWSPVPEGALTMDKRTLAGVVIHL